MVLMAFPLASAVTAPAFSTGVADVTVGQKVTVTATSTPGAQVEVYWEAQKAWDGAQGLLGAAYSTGTSFSLMITIPAAAAGAHDVILKDLGDGSVSSAAITVAPKLAISPMVGLAGDVITVTGTGFNDLEAITMTYWNGAAFAALTTSPLVPQTSALGSFTCTFVVPTAAVTAADNIVALDVTGGTAAAQLTVGPYIVLTPTKGLKSSTVQVAGRGFTPNKLVDIRWYLDTPPTTYVTVLAATPADAAGAFTVSITVPLLPDAVAPGTAYTIRAIDNNVAPVSADAIFTLIQTNAITVTPPTGKVSSTVTVAGTWFSGNSLTSITFDSTEVAVVTTSGTGSFSTTFTVPADATLGAHTVTVTDAKAITASKTYTVVVDQFMVETRATEYMRMDFISLKSQATVATAVDLVFADPSGLVWYGETVTVGEWQNMGPALFQIPYDVLSLTWWPITSDAPLGTWNFTCYASGTTTKLDTNLFTVIAKPTQQDVLDKLVTLKADIQSITTTSEGKIIAAVNTKTGTIMTDLAALNPQLQGITDTAVIIATMLGEVQVDLANLDMSALTSLGTQITAIKGDVATIKTNIGTVDTKVSNLDPVVGAIAGQNAEVLTKLGTLEGKITSIDGNTATIKTNVGTLQADVTDVKGKTDMTPIWIAVVLSLVAAIAAIFAVITIRQKIAG